MRTSRSANALLVAVALLVGVAASPVAATAVEPSMYAVDFVSTAAVGHAMNDQGMVAGVRTTALPPGCVYYLNCTFVTEAVVWSGDTVTPLPLLPGYSTVTPASINASGWVAGWAGDPTTTGSRAVVWKPTGTSYTAIDLGVLPNTTRSWAAGIDDQGRTVGWTTDDPTFPTHTAPFVWTEAGGQVDLSAQGFPNEWPLDISPGGTVATVGYWYRLGDPGSVTALAPPPPGFSGPGNYPAAINDAGDQARFQISTGSGFFPYLFRYNHAGTWQQIRFSPCGMLAPCGLGGINAARDITATVGGVGLVAYGPNGLAESLSAKISPAYGGEGGASGGPITDSGTILSGVMIGLEGRLVRLVAAEPCGSGCIRVASIQMTGKMIGRPRGQCTAKASNYVTATLTVTDKAGKALSGAKVTGRFLDEYYLDEPVTGKTDGGGTVVFTHRGPACVGATTILVDDVAKRGRVLDITTGELADSVVPQPP